MGGADKYTIGYVGEKSASSDKGASVVALTMFNLRKRERSDVPGCAGSNVYLRI
ncbi:hypothetical protein ACHAWF_012079 [Thalassiosira exigua]